MGKRNQRFTEANQKLITDFYVNPDVVYNMPGMHDEMTVWGNGIKSKMQEILFNHIFKGSL